MAKADMTKTPDSLIKNWVRRGWQNCRERNTALKRARYTCNKCGAKKSVAKGREVSVNVHHKSMKIRWDLIYKVIREELLQTPDDYEVLCKACHHLEHHK